MPKDENALKECRLLIGGEWVSGAETFPVKDKFTGETVAQAHKPSRAQVAEDALPAEDDLLAPDAIAQNYLALHRQPRSAWTHEMDLRPWVEKF